MKAKLRVCASCEWVFLGGVECPQCGFGSYGARYVYGNRAYRYKKTQEPWIERKIEHYRLTLMDFVDSKLTGHVGLEIKADTEYF